ncbi:MAG TPA: DNA-binding protein [Desulfotomaculum sp.]|nr:MAG: DNA-binding protein [Peptococcaceae bacterium BRH_c8a]KJS76426.1 MAG: DNA-binding protein [Desulfotomaculum sp. BICA1-6]HBX22376.1 DNA-binding protein [Desulfotomaculum sp.]
MDKVTLLTLLFDFYGQLLTERQQKFVELYYGNDYSLGEIAESYNVSRQAVHDTLKRADIMLQNYEQKLQLVNKFLTQRSKLAEAARLLEECSESVPGQALRAKEILQEVLEMDRG